MSNTWAIKKAKEIILDGLDGNTNIILFENINILVNSAVNGDDSSFAKSIQLLENKGLSYQEAYNLMMKARGISTQKDSKAGRIGNADHSRKIAAKIREQYANRIDDKQYNED